jgi:hypothetical protein
MKLKFELVNGYGVLVDEEAEIKEGDWYFDAVIGLHQKLSDLVQTTVKLDRWKIIFAEKELGLDVPVFEWRDFEVEKLAKKSLPDDTDWQKRFVFVQGYKSNPAKYTEEDLRKAYIQGKHGGITQNYMDFEEFIKSLQKYPKWVVMESEIISLIPTGNHTIKKEDVSKTFKTDFKLFTNSEGKQQGTVKELIWG